MLCLLAFGDHEALMADTPTFRNFDSASTESPLLFRTDQRNHPGRPHLGSAQMLCLLAFGDHEALMADTPTSQNVDSA